MPDGSTRIWRWLCAALLVFPCIAGITAQVTQKTESAPIVFVCEHGNVKSLIASSLFNKEAMERRLPFHAVARGITPGADVPREIAEPLRDDGIDVGNFKPERLASKDLADAVRVIAIGVDLANFENASSVRIDIWGDVPPASVDYEASRASLLRHIDALLADLQAGQDK